uniref:Extracellular Cu/Zn superoxide dismutase n=1 Tax=Tetranychus cinnabarinus TaxID=93129 RepID=A0A2I2MT45_TETCI|nr:extracellular Cu/Zn superoxide dismutase [Tetranychus cinnabarinus]
MKISFCFLILLITKILSQSTDSSVDYHADEGFERDVQPTEGNEIASESSPVTLPPPNTHPINNVYLNPIFAEAIIRGGSNVRGVIYFQNSWNGVGIYGIVCGLRPGNHGFHIHQFGSILSGCDASGPHFSMVRWYHGGPTDKYRHAGDLGNLQADQRGIAFINQFNSQITLKPANNPVLGRAILVHEWPDDLGVGRKDSNITGNVGKAIACGVIGLRPDKPQFPTACPPPNI